jgi:hypothetical protein
VRFAILLFLVAWSAATQENTAKVTIYYPFLQMAMDTAEILIDSSPVAKVHRGKKIELRLSAGHHVLGVKKWRAVPAVKPADFVFEAGKEYIIQLETQQTSYWRMDRHFVPELDLRVGVQHTEHLKFIDQNKVIDCAVIVVPACVKP